MCNLSLLPHMSENERKIFRRLLLETKSYFEYGSGGSSVWAVAMGHDVFGVESDSRYVASLREKLGKQYRVNCVDIGPVGPWGKPLTNKYEHLFHTYSEDILNYTEHFELVLIDGRFRVASCLSVVERSIIINNFDTIIFFHDFCNRIQYHSVLEYVDEIGRIDTACIFRPKRVDLNKIREYKKNFIKLSN